MKTTATRGIYVDNVRLRATNCILRSPRLSRDTAAASAKEAPRSVAPRQH
jgi:hypothetical protein